MMKTMLGGDSAASGDRGLLTAGLEPAAKITAAATAEWTLRRMAILPLAEFYTAFMKPVTQCPTREQGTEGDRPVSEGAQRLSAACKEGRVSRE
jgi:hypothetical protein